MHAIISLSTHTHTHKRYDLTKHCLHDYSGLEVWVLTLFWWISGGFLGRFVFSRDIFLVSILFQSVVSSLLIHGCSAGIVAMPE